MSQKSQTTNVDTTEKQHFFAINFIYCIDEDEKTCRETLYAFFPDQLVTMARIKKIKEAFDIPVDAALLSASYLGFMTLDEFNHKE